MFVFSMLLSVMRLVAFLSIGGWLISAECVGISPVDGSSGCRVKTTSVTLEWRGWPLVAICGSKATSWSVSMSVLTVLLVSVRTFLVGRLKSPTGAGRRQAPPVGRR